MDSAWIGLGGTAIMTIVGVFFHQIIIRRFEECDKRSDEQENKLKDYSQILFKRMDENKMEANTTFLRKDIFQEKHDNLLNRVDDKFETLLDHIEELKKAIVDLSERIK